MEPVSLFAVHMPHSVDKEVIATLHEDRTGIGNPMLGQGPKVDEFEALLATYFGTKNVLTTNSGTSALQLALRLSDVSGGEVVTTPMTCTATNMPILAEGAVPVWADVDPNTGLIDPLDVERKITKKTRAIMCVHWGGTPCDLEALNGISKKYGIPLIEDAAHAFGATYNGAKIGSGSANFTAFSFQAIKHITTGDGGLLITRSNDDYARGKLLRWYGIDREAERKDFRCEADIAEWGYKFHMNDLAATIGIAQLPYLDGILKAHRDNALTYMRDIPRPVAAQSPDGDWMGNAYWLYTALCSSADEREMFTSHMKKWNIQVSQVHARNDSHTAFSHLRRSPLPGVDQFTERMICLPVNWKITPEQRQQVINACQNYENSIRMGIA